MAACGEGTAGIGCGVSACWRPSPRTIRTCRRASRDSGRVSTARMVGGPQCAHRHSLRGRQGRSVSAARQGAGRPATRRDLRTIDAGRRRFAAGEPRDPDRIRLGLRPDRLWLHRQSGAAGRQSHGPAALSRRASLASGWRCSRRSRRAWRAPPCGQPQDDPL